MITIAVLVIANLAFWGASFYRQHAQPPAFTATLTTVDGPVEANPSPGPTVKATPTQTPTPAPTPSPLPLPDTSGRSLSVSIVGDSLESGSLRELTATRFRGLMLAALQARGGVTTEEAVRSTGALSADVTVPDGLDLVVLELGTDDMTRTDVNGFEAVYGPLVKAVRLGSPHAALVCAGTWSANGQAYDNVIKQDCDSAQGHFVSLQRLYDVAANRGPAGVAGYYGVSDDVAPNDAGHRAIAQALLAPVGISLP